MLFINQGLLPVFQFWSHGGNRSFKGGKGKNGRGPGTAFKNQPLGLSMLEITAKSMGVSRLENYPIDFFIGAILKDLNRLLDENLTLLDNPKIIGTFLTPSNSSFLRYNFITFYIVFLSVRGDLSPERMATFLSKFTPDIALSLITVFYIHEIIKH